MDTGTVLKLASFYIKFQKNLETFGTFGQAMFFVASSFYIYCTLLCNYPQIECILISVMFASTLKCTNIFSTACARKQGCNELQI